MNGREYYPLPFRFGSHNGFSMVCFKNSFSIDHFRRRHFGHECPDLLDNCPDLFALPSVDCLVVFNNGIDALSALDEVQTAGKIIGILDTQRLGLLSGQCPVGFQGCIQVRIFRNRQLSLCLQILHHIEVVDHALLCLSEFRIGCDELLVRRLAKGSAGTKDRERTIEICLHCFHSALADLIISVTLCGSFPERHHQLMIDLLDTISFRNLTLGLLHFLQVFPKSLPLVGPLEYIGGIAEESMDFLCKLFQLITRHFCPVFFGKESIGGNQLRHSGCGLIPFQFDFGIGRNTAAMTEREALIGVSQVVISSVVAGVFAVVMGQIPLPFCLVRMGPEVGIYSQTILNCSTAQNLVDLILGDEILPLGIIVLCSPENNRLLHQILHPLQKLHRPGVMEMQQVLVVLIDCRKKFQFVCNPTQHIGVCQHILHLFINLGEARMAVICFGHERHILRFHRFFAELPAKIHQTFCDGLSFIRRYRVQLTLGHIPSQIQQFPDADSRLLPGQMRCKPFSDRVTVGDLHSLRGIPDGYLSAVKVETRTVGTIVLAKKCRILSCRSVLHESGTDDQSAVTVIGTNTQSFVNDLLGHRGIGDQRHRRILFGFRHGQIHKRDLVIQLTGHLDRIIQAEGLILDQISRQFSHQLPRKNGLLFAGKERSLPHKKSVILGMITHTHTIDDHFRKSVRVCAFNVLGALLRIRVGCKVQLDFLPGVLQVIILVGEDLHDMQIIRKRRKCVTPCVFIIQL